MSRLFQVVLLLESYPCRFTFSRSAISLLRILATARRIGSQAVPTALCKWDGSASTQTLEPHWVYYPIRRKNRGLASVGVYPDKVPTKVARRLEGVFAAFRFFKLRPENEGLIDISWECYLKWYHSIPKGFLNSPRLGGVSGRV